MFTSLLEANHTGFATLVSSPAGELDGTLITELADSNILPEDVELLNMGKSGGMDLKKNYVDTLVEAGVGLDLIPKHVAIIMDGNR
jgi:hypothetical protein